MSILLTLECRTLHCLFIIRFQSMANVLNDNIVVVKLAVVEIFSLFTCFTVRLRINYIYNNFLSSDALLQGKEV